MNPNTLTYWKHEAKSRGIPWDQLRAVYEELRLADEESIRHLREIHRSAYEKLSPYAKTCAEHWWRGGLQIEFRHALTEGDQTMIPGLDTAAQEIACQFPELRRDQDPATALYRILKAGYPKAARTKMLMERAIELCRPKDAGSYEYDQVPF